MSEPKEQATFALAGCGFLGIYHIGVAACLREHVPHLLDDKVRMAGASAGALIAACLVCQVDLDHCIDFTMRLARSARQHPLGGFEPGVDIDGMLRKSVEAILPEDAHRICTDRLFVSCSAFRFRKNVLNMGLDNVLISKFESKKDLIDVLMCSAFVPGFSNYGLPTCRGRYLFDGGLTDNIPLIDADTITISPWAGEHCISPSDTTGHTYPMTVMGTSINPTGNNLLRFNDAFIPPAPEDLKRYCWDGYDDCLRFLADNGMINCDDHRVFTHLVRQNKRPPPPSDSCKGCRDQLQHALHSSLSEQMQAMISDEPEDQSLIGGLGRLVSAPVRTTLSILVVPIQMLRDSIIELYLGVQFGLKTKKFDVACEEMFRALSSPAILFYNLITSCLSKAIFGSFEYLARVASIVTGSATDTWKVTKTAVKQVCQCASTVVFNARDIACVVCQRPRPVRPCNLCGYGGHGRAARESSSSRSPSPPPKTSRKKRRTGSPNPKRRRRNPRSSSHSPHPPAAPSGDASRLARRRRSTPVPRPAREMPDTASSRESRELDERLALPPPLREPRSRRSSRLCSANHPRSDDEVSFKDAAAIAAALSESQKEAKAEAGKASGEGDIFGAPYTHTENAPELEVVMDINVEQVRMAIQLAEAEMVTVGGSGPIDKVQFDSISYAKEWVADQEAEGGEADDVVERREPRADKLHDYVQKLQRYKPVMTMHYRDDKNQQHTESLYVEPHPEKGGEGGKKAKGSRGGGKNVKGSRGESKKAKEARGESKKAKEARESPKVEEEEPRRESLNESRGENDQEEETGGAEELRQILEEKVMNSQREFEKEYQQQHQKKLKKLHARESSAKAAGSYRLKVISFNEELPCSPGLSRSNSQRSVNDSPLVRSVSDASSLASDVRKNLRSLAKARRQQEEEQRWEQEESSSRRSGGLLRRNASAENLTRAAESALAPPSEDLRRSVSDTSAVASNLLKLGKTLVSGFSSLSSSVVGSQVSSGVGASASAVGGSAEGRKEEKKRKEKGGEDKAPVSEKEAVGKKERKEEASPRKEKGSKDKVTVSEKKVVAKKETKEETSPRKEKRSKDKAASSEKTPVMKKETGEETSPRRDKVSKDKATVSEKEAGVKKKEDGDGAAPGPLSRSRKSKEDANSLRSSLNKLKQLEKKQDH